MIAGTLIALAGGYYEWRASQTAKADEARIKGLREREDAENREKEKRTKEEKERREAAISAKAGSLKPTESLEYVSYGSNISMGCEGAGIVFLKDGCRNPDGPDVIFEDGALQVSATIRDRNFEVIGKIEKNEWSRVPDRGDRNYSDTAFEVIGPDDEVVLQVVNWGAVEVRMLTYIAPGVMRGISDEAGIVSGTEDHVRSKVKLKRMFKYPSQLHLGELVE